MNLIKLEDRQYAPDSDRHVISIASWKIRKFNEHLLQRFSDMLGLDFTSIKSNPAYETLRNYGAINVAAQVGTKVMVLHLFKRSRSETPGQSRKDAR